MGLGYLFFIINLVNVCYDTKFYSILGRKQKQAYLILKVIKLNIKSLKK